MRRPWTNSNKISWSLRRVLIYVRYHTELYVTVVVTSFLFLFTFISILLTRSFSRVNKCQNPVHLYDDIYVESDLLELISTQNSNTVPTSDDVFTKPLSMKEWLQKSEDIYQNSIHKRHEHIKSLGGISKVNPWPGNGVGVVYYWDFFQPSFSCPHLMERVGTIGDGGKWVCGFEIFKENPHVDKCVIYSFGVANESSFEAEFLSKTTCEIHAFDFSVDKLGYQILDEHVGKRIHFNKIGLDNRDKNATFLTLGTLMRQRQHDWIDILKIDIEGSEFPCLEQIMDEFPENLPFGQLLLELHVDHFGRGFPAVIKWWEKLESRGLRAYHNEVNHHSCVGLKINPVAIEYSFLNVKGRHRVIRIGLDKMESEIIYLSNLTFAKPRIECLNLVNLKLMEYTITQIP